MTGEAADAEELFVGPDAASRARLGEAVTGMLDALERAAPGASGPWSGADPAALAAAIESLDPCPDDGRDQELVLAEIADVVLAHGVAPSHPLAFAHLQNPPLIPAAAAELAIGATNQSLDSYDQAPAATLVEDRMVRWLGAAIGFAERASGVLTSGGTASNLLALLCARDRAARRGGHDVARAGLPPERERWRIVTSAAAHESVRMSAAVLGLGADAVTSVPPDGRGRMSRAALATTLADLTGEGLVPIAVVATAGTTDAGAIDELDPIAEQAAEHGAWLHVDAAVGSALVLSDRLRPRLRGIERADSVTADLHKLWWQPISASALLVRERDSLRPPPRTSDYLHRDEDVADGVLNLVGRSLDTSRRFDALKLLVSLRTVGRRRLAAMVEHVVDLAVAAAAAVERRPELELLAQPETVMVLLRCRPTEAEPDGDRLNADVQRRLFASGRALVGRTRVDGAVALKLTFVNPRATVADVDAVLDLIVAEARTVAT